ncbi:lipopolysaccharide transport periplasmic protein LptA [Marinobacter sp. KMM 10035]|uniref:lipopolysaccharide transport periplasmic protein LptA n=1 Tax=Marinobacter TaxID=2742 RepID=UPI00397B2578
MKPLNNTLRRLLITAVAAGLMNSAMAFDLDSDQPITVSADSARLDDGKGIATYTGAVELTQGKTRLSAERVVLYRSAEGLNRIEASGSPARYQQPVTSGEGKTDAQAKNITWSATDKQLTFEREAVIEQNGNVFRGDIIHYDTEQRVVTAEGGEDTGAGPGRVEMVIQPRGNSTDSTQ